MHSTKLAKSPFEQVSAKEMRVAQEHGPVIGKVRQAILQGLWPPSKVVADPNFVLV